MTFTRTVDFSHADLAPIAWFVGNSPMLFLSDGNAVRFLPDKPGNWTASTGRLSCEPLADAFDRPAEQNADYQYDGKEARATDALPGGSLVAYRNAAGTGSTLVFVPEQGRPVVLGTVGMVVDFIWAQPGIDSPLSGIDLLSEIDTDGRATWVRLLWFRAVSGRQAGAADERG